MNWLKVEEHLPVKKEGWDYSERVLVLYADGEYGIAYYHYDPPYAKPGFIDFAHYGRQPIEWTDIQH